jgi:hypothetical protein
MNAAQPLNRFAEQTGAIMLFSYDLANARRTSAVRGHYTLLEGLELLLRAPDFRAAFPTNALSTSRKAGTGQRPAEEPPVLAASAASGQEANPETQALEEVIVTAQKRAERLAEVPVPVTVIDAAVLATQNQVLLRGSPQSI